MNIEFKPLIDFYEKGNNGNIQVKNLVNGEWTSTRETSKIISPLNGNQIFTVPETHLDETDPFAQGLKDTPQHGLHNPLRNVHRYKSLSQVFFNAAVYLDTEAGLKYFSFLVQMCMPKSYKQCEGEVIVTRQFLKNYGGDRGRFLAKGFTSPGDHDGQQPHGYRWPFGATVNIDPFNFPIEIPVLQTAGSLLTGNRPLVKVDSKVAIVMYEFIRLLIACGLDPHDLDFINCSGKTMGEFLVKNADHIEMCQFTGSTGVADFVTSTLQGRIRREDAGLDWKILGPDIPHKGMQKKITQQCDQDANAASGQKCSAQSLVFIHRNWLKTDIFEDLKFLANQRTLENLTVGPILTWTTKQLLDHIEKVLAIPGARLLFGGKELENHSIPKEYGAIRPTGIFIPYNQILKHPELVTTEVFAPVCIYTSYQDEYIDEMIEFINNIEHKLTAAIVSNEQDFIRRIASQTNNGTTYVGLRARTTGAPQNHWFGPKHALAAGIGTDEAILITWTCHREIISDKALVDEAYEFVDVT